MNKSGNEFRDWICKYFWGLDYNKLDSEMPESKKAHIQTKQSQIFSYFLFCIIGAFLIASVISLLVKNYKIHPKNEFDKLNIEGDQVWTNVNPTTEHSHALYPWIYAYIHGRDLVVSPDMLWSMMMLVISKNDYKEEPGDFTWENSKSNLVNSQNRISMWATWSALSFGETDNDLVDTQTGYDDEQRHYRELELIRSPRFTTSIPFTDAFSALTSMDDEFYVFMNAPVTNSSKIPEMRYEGTQKDMEILMNKVSGIYLASTKNTKKNKAIRNCASAISMLVNAFLFEEGNLNVKNDFIKITQERVRGNDFMLRFKVSGWLLHLFGLDENDDMFNPNVGVHTSIEHRMIDCSHSIIKLTRWFGGYFEDFNNDGEITPVYSLSMKVLSTYPQQNQGDLMNLFRPR